jgi:hypothetical protein
MYDLDPVKIVDHLMDDIHNKDVRVSRYQFLLFL